MRAGCCEGTLNRQRPRAIDSGSPARMGASFEPWLTQRMRRLIRSEERCSPSTTRAGGPSPLINSRHPPSALGLAGCIRSLAEDLRAVLGYKVGPAPEALQAVEEVVMLAGSRSGFRGQRLRFCCPGCGRRVEELYLNEAYFRCRRCCGLGYRSQRKNREDRGLEKGARIRERLGGEGDYAEPFPERPKGMHQRTRAQAAHTPPPGAAAATLERGRAVSLGGDGPKTSNGCPIPRSGATVARSQHPLRGIGERGKA